MTSLDTAPRRGRPPVGRRFPMTLPDDLRALLEVAATESGRSLSAECTARLAASFATPNRRKETKTMPTLPGEWQLVQVSGWLPFGKQGKLTDTRGWIVCQPHVLGYADDQEQINRAETCGRTARAAIDAFIRKHPTCAPRAY